MHINLYTKVVLTVIALLLAVVALKPFIQPQSVAAQSRAAVVGQSSLAGVQFSSGEGYTTFFDTTTGDIWVYRGLDLVAHTKVTQLGKPMVALSQ